MTWLLILAALMLSAAVVLAYRYGSAGCFTALAGCWLLSRSGYAPVMRGELLFWCAATLIVVTVDMNTRAGLRSFRPSVRRFIATGALMGALVGATLGHAAIICGAAIGALAGTIAAKRKDPVRTTMPHFVAAQLPEIFAAIVTMSMVGISLSDLLVQQFLNP